MDIMAPPSQTTPKPLSAGRVLAYSLANLGAGAFYAFNNAALPLWMKHYTSNAVLLGLMAGTHSYEGAVVQPLVGSWSDRLRTRIGRRRPFMLLFVPLSALFLLLTPPASHLPPGVRLAAIVAAVVLFTLTFNVAQDPYQSLMPDITPPDERGRVAGVWNFVGALGQVTVLLLPLPLSLKFGAVAALMLVTTGLTALLTPEPRLPPHAGPARRRRDDLRDAFDGLRTLRQARIYLVMFFCYGAGTDAVTPFLTLFIQKITGCSDTTAQHMFLVLMATVALGTLAFGWVSDRIGPRRLLLLSMSVIAVAAVNGLWVHTLAQVGLVLGLAGLGIAAQNASAYPLLTKLVPAEEIGFYTGLQTTALSVAGPAALGLTGTLINHAGYRMIFAVCSVCVFAALAVLTRLRQTEAAGEVAARDAQQGRLPAAVATAPA